MSTDRHGNNLRTDSVNRHRRTFPIRKVPVSDVPAKFYPDMVSRNGRTCWAAFEGGVIVCIGSTSIDCREKYYAWGSRQHADDYKRGG